MVGSTAGLTLELDQVRQSPIPDNPFKVTDPVFEGPQGCGEVLCIFLLTWFPWGTHRGGEKDMILTGLKFI